MGYTPYRRNLPLFIAFRVLFNARFYYPVLGVLFIDLGLTLEQYVILNAVWAATIILLEIPSGALADLIGRRRMVVAAGFLMIAEMAVFAFAPTGAPLFWLLMLNRILSGTAEACASGADEALAYDSLPEEERASAWPTVLARLMRWSAAAFFVAMIAGAAVFDAEMVNRVLSWLGLSAGWTSAETLRWPVYLTLATAFGATACAVAMVEVPRTVSGSGQTVAGAVSNILFAGRFVFSHRNIVLLLLTGVLFDSTIRLFLTFASNFYRLIELPPAANGVLGSAFAVLGFAAAGMAKRLVGRLPAPAIAILLGGVLCIALFGVCLATPIWGVWVVVPIGLVMPMVQFFLSNYLNAWTGSDLRATVLSFRGVALNLGYGFAGLGFAAITSALRGQSPGIGENELFAQTLFVLPAAFLAGAVALAVFSATMQSAPRR